MTERFYYADCYNCGAKIREGEEGIAPNGVKVAYHRNVMA